jgi:DNA polymerase III subunit epsilon
MRTDQPQNSTDFVIYDLETTGLRAETEDFIQLAAIRFRDGRPCVGDTFASFARPSRLISSFITSYTGITNSMVRAAPPPGEVLREFSRWAGGATLIAHNGRRFDSKFLEATCRRYGFAARPVDCIDSIELSRMLFGRVRGTGHSLDHVQSRLGLEICGRRHDARGDVELLALAVAEMHRRLDLGPDFTGVCRHSTLLPQL